MEDLSSYYKELNILQLKYEHFLETAKTLLKPWPNPKRSSASATAAAEKEQTDENGTELPPLSAPNIVDASPETRELEKIDALLDKAQKMRLSNKPEEEEKPSRQSLRLASGVYKPSARPHHQQHRVPIPHHHAKKSSRGRSRQTAAARGHTYDHTHDEEPVARSGHIHKSATGTGRGHTHDPAAGRGHSHELARGASVSCKHKAQQREVGSEPRAKGFSLQTNGEQLSMPTEYRKLLKTIARCEEALEEDLTSKTAAAHFSKRLMSKHRKERVDGIRLVLLAQEIQLLKAKLVAITPYEWTVSNRSSWEEVLAVKTKCDLLLECYHTAVSMGDMRDAQTTIGEKKNGRHQLVDESGGRRDGVEFGYSSLKDWSLLVEMTLRRRFNQCEMRFLTEIQQTLLPLLSRCCNQQQDSCRHRHHCDNGVASLLRVASQCSNIPATPIYLETQQRGPAPAPLLHDSTTTNLPPPPPPR